VDDELDRLAAKGRALRESDAEREAPKPPASGEARARMRGSLSRYVRWGWLVVVVVVTLATMAIRFAMPSDLPRPDPGEGVIDPFVILAFVISALLAWLPRWLIGERAIARETEWARSQPFPLLHYPEALGNETTAGRFAIAIDFAPTTRVEVPDASFREPASRAATTIDDAMLADVFRTARARMRQGEKGRTRTAFITLEYEDSNPPTNAHAAQWMREIVPVLVALHGRTPIARVRVTGFDR
jgi:hypothetical protein